MSHYWVGKLCFDATRNPALVEEYKKDPEALLNRYRFTEEEKQRLRDCDAPYFYQLGINPYLVGRIGSFMEFNMGDMGSGRMAFYKALQPAGAHPLLPFVSFPGPAPLAGKYLIRDEDL